MFKDFFYFSRGDRRAILILSALLLIGVFCLWHSSQLPMQEENFVVADTAVLQTVEDSLHVAYGRKKRNSDAPSIDKGKRISINSPRAITDVRKGSIKAAPSWRDERVRKFRSDTLLDLNTVDTLLLKRVPGIGSWRARRIVQFRDYLGGYSRVGQLLEIDGMPDSVLRWFVIHTPVYKRLNLNLATVDEMAAHPYLTYRQARVILRHKKKHGPLRSLNQLSLYREFSKDTLEWLEPYVIF